MAKELARRDPARDLETSTPFLHMSTEGRTSRCQEMSGLPYLSLAAAYPLISPGMATARGPFSREVLQRSLLDVRAIVQPLLDMEWSSSNMSLCA